MRIINFFLLIEADPYPQANHAITARAAAARSEEGRRTGGDFKKYGDVMLPTGVLALVRLNTLLMFIEKESVWVFESEPV